jgi:anaerobic selenocysteine-containing dehydrogenase
MLNDMGEEAIPDMEGAVNKGLLCGKGRFGFDCAQLEGKLVDPMIKKENGLEEVNYHEAFMVTAKKAQAIGAKYGKDAVAVAISDRYTNEEAYAIKIIFLTLIYPAVSFILKLCWPFFKESRHAFNSIFRTEWRNQSFSLKCYTSLYIKADPVIY